MSQCSWHSMLEPKRKRPFLVRLVLWLWQAVNLARSELDGRNWIIGDGRNPKDRFDSGRRLHETRLAVGHQPMKIRLI